MRFHLFIIGSIFSFQNLFSQNIIPNPSFEDVNICIEHNVPCAPAGWITTSSFLPKYSGQSGDKYVSITGFNSSKRKVRQYIQTQLLCQLEKGKKYKFSIQIKQDECLIQSVGILFSDSLIYTNSDKLIELTPTIDLSNNISSQSKRIQKKWLTIELDYIANGNEKFILIGNFQSDDGQKREFINEQKEFTSYYFSIDNISLIDPEIDSLCQNSLEIKNHWYSYRVRHSPIRINDYLTKVEKDTINPVDLLKSNQKVDTITLTYEIFEFNSSVLNKDAKKKISEIISHIEIKSVEKISIVAHTDIIGNHEYNLTLSKMRSISVKELLIEIGVEENRIETFGMGDVFPIADNNTENGREKNRRIEINIVYK